MMKMIELKPEDQANQVAEVKQGERLTIRLRSPGGTGYLWKLSLDENRCRVVDYIIRGGRGAFGAPGEDLFVVEALSEGECHLRFALQAPWEAEPAKAVELTVRARPGTDRSG